MSDAQEESEAPRAWSRDASGQRRSPSSTAAGFVPPTERCPHCCVHGILLTRPCGWCERPDPADIQIEDGEPQWLCPHGIGVQGQGDQEAPPPADVTDDLVDRHRIWDDAIETVSGDSPIGVRERLREEYDRTFARYRIAPTGYDLGYLDALDVAIVMLDGLRLPRLRRSWKLRRALIEVVNVLGPTGLCTCEAPCEELRTEAAAALAIARTALAETNTARSAG